MSDMWTVKQNTGQHEGRRLFEGLEDDARTYIERNYPRPHIEPGAGYDELKADVHLHSPDGVKEHFMGDGHEEPWQFVDKDTPKTTKGRVTKDA